MRFLIIVFVSFAALVMAGPKPSYDVEGNALVSPREPFPCVGCVSFLERLSTLTGADKIQRLALAMSKDAVGQRSKNKVEKGCLKKRMRCAEREILLLVELHTGTGRDVARIYLRRNNFKKDACPWLASTN